MRFYGFGNYYLSSLQQGLQAGHAAVDLHVKYNLERHDSEHCKHMYNDWAQNHKTMVLLNGGNSADLQELFNFLSDRQNPYPFVKFHEDEISLNGALTYVGLILPPKIYDTVSYLRNRAEHFFDGNTRTLVIKTVEQTIVLENFITYEYSLCQRLMLYSLAK